MSIHWTKEQQNRLATLIDQGAWLGYWCSDENGEPANGGRRHPDERVSAGLVQRMPYSVGYHATREPHRYSGSRVWVVALNEIVGEEGDKSWGRVREVVGEITLDDAIVPSVRVRLGVFDELAGADMQWGHLIGTDLRGCDLRGADLRHAYLMNARMAGANLRGADLRWALMAGADMSGSDLCGANMSGASLKAVDLRDVDLRGVDMRRAYGRDDWPDLVARGAVR